MATSRWLSAEEERAWRAFRRMTIKVRAEIVSALVATGLSEADYEVLSSLVDRPDVTSTLHAQATKMGWSRSRLSRHASRMEARGLLSRAPDPEDGRGCLLVLSREGRAALRAATPAHLESVRRCFVEPLDDEDLRAIIRLSSRLCQVGPESEPSDAAEDQG